MTSRPDRIQTAAAFLLTLLILGTVAAASGGDWPQFRGPNRDGVSSETGLLTSWPEGGPPVLWRVPLGIGFSSAAVVGGRIFTMDSRDESEYAVCLDAEDGRELWRTEVGPLFWEATGDGPRATPTVEGGTVWAIGSLGDVVALRTDDGAPIWRANLQQRFGTPPQLFGFAMMPLIDGDHLIIEAGAAEGGSIVALDKMDGELAWRTPTSGPVAYSSPIRVNWQDTEQLLFLNTKDLVSVSPQGELLWAVPFGTESPIKVVFPIFVEPDLVFVSASYDIGGMAVRLKRDNGSGPVTAEVVWKSRVMRNHFGTCVARGGLIYGFDNSTLRCIEAATGTERWARRRRFGKGSLTWADGHLIVLTERGQLVLVEATGEGYREKGEMALFAERTWTPPSLAKGQLYVRSASALARVDLSAGGPEAAAPTAISGPESAPAGAVVPAAATLDAEAVVAHYLEARGGEAALARIETIRQSGHYLYHGVEYPFTIYHKRPHRYRYEYRLPTGELVIEAYDGTTGWQENSEIWKPGATEMLLLPRGEIRAERLELILEDEADFAGPLVGYQEKGHKVELLGGEMLDDGTPVHHLRITLKSGRTQDYYLDQRTFTVVRKTNRNAGPMTYFGIYDCDWFYTKYRRVSGVLLPVLWEREDLQLVRIFEVERTEVNVDLDDGLFTMAVENPEDAPLFEAAVQATKEVIGKALVAGETMAGNNGNVIHALPHDRLQEALRKYNRRQASRPLEEILSEVHTVDFSIPYAPGKTIFVTEYFTLQSLIRRPARAAIFLTAMEYRGDFWDVPVEGYSGPDMAAERGFFAYTTDYLGIGKSYRPKDGGKVDYRGNAEPVGKLIDFVRRTRQVDRLDLIGEGHGCEVASVLAAEPERVRSVVMSTWYYKELGGVTEILTPEFKALMESRPNGYWVPNVMAKTLAHVGNQEIRDYVFATQQDLEVPTGPFLQLFDSGGLAHTAKAAKVPALIITPELSAWPGPGDMNDLEADWGGGATLVVLQGSYHVSRMETPDVAGKYFQALFDFIDP